MPAETDLTLLRTHVQSDWVDYNGHMNDACYAQVFSQAVDAWMDLLGLDAGYRSRTGRSLFTLETHLCYLHEAVEGEPLRVSGELLGHDAKRLHVFLTLWRGDEAVRLATSEQMLLHVDLAGPGAASFGEDVLERLAQRWETDQTRPLPPEAGRGFRSLKQTRMAPR